MHISERHAVLRKLISSGNFYSQEDLLDALCAKGYRMTQATLSRDLKRIGAIKREGRYTTGPVGYALDGFSKIVEMVFVEPNMIVLKTSPGLAQAAASLIDAAAISGIVGTIAGDDTIMAAIDSPKKEVAIQKTLAKLFARVR